MFGCFPESVHMPQGVRLLTALISWSGSQGWGDGNWGAVIQDTSLRQFLLLSREAVREGESGGQMASWARAASSVRSRAAVRLCSHFVLCWSPGGRWDTEEQLFHFETSICINLPAFISKFTRRDDYVRMWSRLNISWSGEQGRPHLFGAGRSSTTVVDISKKKGLCWRCATLSPQSDLASVQTDPEEQWTGDALPRAAHVPPVSSREGGRN